MNEQDDWAGLQEAWRRAAPAALPDMAPMIARARRQRHAILWLLATEWAMALAAVALMVRHWGALQANWLMVLWCAYGLLAMAAVLAGSTRTRLAALHEPAGANLRDWLQLRRRRAQAGLRLARITRWSALSMLPAPLVALSTARTVWGMVWGATAMVLLLAGSWLWARRRTAAMTRELADVDALAREWLDEDPAPTA